MARARAMRRSIPTRRRYRQKPRSTFGTTMTKVVPWAVCWSRWYSNPRSGIAMAPPPTPKRPPKNPAAPPSAVVASIRNAAESIQVISRCGPRTGPRDNTPIGRGREHLPQALRPNYRTYSMVRLLAGNGPSIRLCARAWWISVLSSVQVNRFTCASRKVLYCGAAKDFPRISKSRASPKEPIPLTARKLERGSLKNALPHRPGPRSAAQRQSRGGGIPRAMGWGTGAGFLADLGWVFRLWRLNNGTDRHPFDPRLRRSWPDRSHCRGPARCDRRLRRNRRYRFWLAQRPI